MNKQILYVSLLCVCIIATVTGIRQEKEKEQESLMDFGYKNKERNAPLAYKKFALRLKYPNLNKNEDTKKKFIDLTSNTKYSPQLFNKKDLRKYYSKKEMQHDFKYFNNASNLSLYHDFNNQE